MKYTTVRAHKRDDVDVAAAASDRCSCCEL